MKIWWMMLLCWGNGLCPIHASDVWRTGLCGELNTVLNLPGKKSFLLR